MRVVLSLAGACVLACAEPTPPPASRPARAPAAVSSPRPSASEPPAVPPPAAPSPEVTTPRFPPADFPPPEPRSAQPGDGHWIRFGDVANGDRAGEGERPVFVRSVVHPHPISKWVSVALVAIDLTRVGVHLVAGTSEPVSADAPAELRTGLVASEHRDSILAVFNGGWKTAHGRWGVMVSGHTFVAPRREGCTIALMKDRSVRVGSWPALEGKQREMNAFRQTPPCLLEGGKLHALLEAGQERDWGGMDPRLKTRLRSAVGVDASGKILYFAYGEEAGAKKLAEGLRAAGVVDAAELDINYIWTRFLLFGTRKDGQLGITSTLAPKMAKDKGAYVDRAHPRDFFYLTRLAQ